ncbi:putative acetyltransferase-like [Iris pallida]|uniref:Acetyltransferase-like n=1 Tax=Iris pallida TaxID=29817 RepID=A0AAX6GH40_IRIPA|nr:putative acetyltransferase-like [Iris pallida]
MPTMASPTPLVQQISKCTVKPAPPPPHSAAAAAAAAVENMPLSVWDVAMLSAHYIQKGLLFSTPLPSADHLAHKLKSSLSLALRHFHPLAGRLATERAPDGSGLHVSIDCSADRGGAEFIHASAAGVTVAQVLATTSRDVPSFVQDFFPYNLALNHDGHSIPLVAVQLTELADGGAFVALCFNHVVGDGTSFWHFFNSWAEIARSGNNESLALSQPPVHDRWFIDGEAPPVKLPFADPSEFLERFAPPLLRERMFHFSSHSIAKLKAKANAERELAAGAGDTISSFQALSSLMWRSITRARGMTEEQPTSCRLAIQNRGRLRPPLSPHYFGNSIYPMATTTTVGELLRHGLGWAAALLHEAVRSHDDGAIRGLVRKYHERPAVYGLSGFDKRSVMMGSSPRFDMYGCDFGWGKAVALRSGAANKFDGKVSSYPGREGGGSVDLEVCLLPEYMAALEMDEEFMSVVSTS